MGAATNVTGPDVWRGEEIQDDTSWILTFTPGMIEEIDDCLAEAEARKLKIPFDATEFPLDQCLELVHTVTQHLHHGRGLALVRGLPRARYTDEQCELIYWAFAVHLGTPVSQNSRGHLIGHVRNEGLSMQDPNVRAYQTSARLDFHSDQLPVDVLGLFCLRRALRGGASKIVSATAVHNVIREERPDLLDVLYQPFNVDWRGEEPAGENPWYQLPMLSEAGGKVSSRFTSLAYFTSVERYGPHLAQSPEQMEALDFAQEVANRPGMALTMDFQEGDMQFVYNHVILHARDSFEDHADPDLRRHLLRMWVASPMDLRRPLSPLLAEKYKLVEAGGLPKTRD